MDSAATLLVLALLGAPEAAAPLTRPPEQTALAAARLAEARRLVAGLGRLWPGLAERPPTVAVCVEGGGMVAVDAEGQAGWGLFDHRDGPHFKAIVGGAPSCPEWMVEREAQNRGRARVVERDGQRTVSIDLSVPFPRFTLGTPTGGGETGTTEDAVAWIVRGLFEEWIDRILAQPAEDRPPDALPAARARRDAARAAREARLLAEALEAPKTRRARRLSLEFTALRQERLRYLNRWRSNFQERETREGLSLYTVYHALLLGRHEAGTIERPLRRLEPDFAYRRAPELREALLRRLKQVSAQEGVAGLSPGESGLALALLLDRTVHGWRSRLVKERCSLADLLPWPMPDAPQPPPPVPSSS